MPRIFRAFLPVVVASFAVVPACKCSDGSGPSALPSASASASAAPSASGSAAAGDDEVRPVYPLLKGAADPLAVKICGLAYSTAELRADTCCKRHRGKSGFEKECERVVSGALTAKRVTTTDERLSACEKALEAALDGCDWVRPTGLAELPPECRSLFDGTLPARARCRSHLECNAGLFCEGLSPTQAGTCSPPRLDGGCFGGTDSLVALARQDGESRHPACDGVCSGRRCAAFTALGAACKASPECGKDNHCEGTCKKGPATDCSACAFGTRCVGGACKPPKKDGEGCSKEEECRGLCVKTKGAKTGSCGMMCDLPGLEAK